MEKSRIPEMKSGESTEEGFIAGNLYKGIAVSDFSDRTYDFTIDGKRVQVVQKAIQLKPDRICLGFLFLLEEPVRFRLDVLVPENCTNANVALQDKELISFFSPDIPDDPEPMDTVQCGNHEKYSPLKPGEFQSVNFRWESGDVLKFYFYFGNYSK